ncbi:hypothetical protein AK812_SmicGene14011 [Symbiodinium microadriaticum]|uniref:Uncharacterized protein n=1 Tax=Symbiodinium microadriaticum TaxID=2951 RepID=A0A1Q9E6P7_SYMMI|nr:hypothetical protein AK812_SmicGene14011 [Symbiodinium microadriaticum]
MHKVVSIVGRMDGASSHPPAREDEGPKPDADASEEDDPEPMLGLDARSVAAPPMSSEDQPEELDVAGRQETGEQDIGVQRRRGEE